MIKTRFAPSPTGELHVGVARTALFNYLFAKHGDGEFLLRIEDTDRERFVPGATDRIRESLKWLGIAADNIDNPPIQSENLTAYKKAAYDLVNAGKAYICTCTKEQLAADREKQIKEGRPPRYEGHCRDANIDYKTLVEGCYVVRMKMPTGGTIIVDDLIRGKVEFDASLQDDQIILKSDGYPTYHLASVIDDHATGITHIIRAEEWLSSTPKHIILHQMFGFEPPKFAHLSMILGPDHSKLSKRHGATSVLEYKKMGYLPDAIVNFMALLGWNPKNEREIFSLAELVSEFKLENVNKSGAIFDIEKLNHFNAERIKNLPSDELRILIKDFGIDQLSEGEVALIGRGGYKTLKEAAEQILELRKQPEYNPSLLVFKKSSKETTLLGLSGANKKLEEIKDWSESEIQKGLESVVLKNNLSNGDVFWPVRVALSGAEKSPSPVELLLAVGKDNSIKRIEKAIDDLK